MRAFLRTLFAATLALPALTQAAFPTLHLKPVVLSQIHSPTTITHAGDGSGRLFVCDQPGLIHVIDGGMLLPTPFLDLTSTGLDVIYAANTNYSERGLLGLAFHPDFATPSAPGEGKFYVYYSADSQTNQNPSTPQDSVSVVSEFQVSASNSNVANPASERVLLTFGQPQGNHNGGQVEFGPDGMLYIGTGDGGSRDDNRSGHTGGDNNAPPTDNLGNSLDRTNLLGKILRIDPLGNNGPGGEFGIPASNPFVGVSGGIREEIYAFGLRNPWRFSFDDGPGGTNRLFCADVGQGKIEEVDLITSGGNYGWRRFEGTLDLFPGTPNPSGIAPTGPIAQYAHPGQGPSTGLPELGLSITGGFVYRGSAIPALQGKYVFGDYGQITTPGSGRIMGLEETSPGSGSFTLTQALPLTSANPIPSHLLCFGEDESGELYIGSKVTQGVLQLENGFPAGAIYKIVPVTTGSAAVTSSSSSGRDTTLFSENENSNGKGAHIFAGALLNSFPDKRRALVAFSLPTIPTGSIVTTASVRLSINMTVTGSLPFSLHRVTAAWGEGTSDAGEPGGTGASPTNGDATWTYRVYNSNLGNAIAWATPGGDYEPTASATINLNSSSNNLWTSATLGQDVQSWRDSPSTNHGWILIGDENNPSAKRLYSRESSSSSLRPQLTVNYATPPPPTPFETFLTTHFPAALVGEFINPNGDDDGDSIPLQVEHAYGFSPSVFNATSATGFSTAIAPGAADTTKLTLTFRRMPTATDVTYNLQISGNLTAWTTVATSTAGATATGANGGTVISDAAIAGQAPARLVTVEVTLPSGTDAQFVRLETVRSF